MKRLFQKFARKSEHNPVATIRKSFGLSYGRHHYTVKLPGMIQRPFPEQVDFEYSIGSREARELIGNNQSEATYRFAAECQKLGHYDTIVNSLRIQLCDQAETPFEEL